MRRTERPERTSRQRWVNAWICISVYEQKTNSPVRAREVHKPPSWVSAGEQIRTNAAYTFARVYRVLMYVLSVTASKESHSAFRLVYID